MDPFLELMRQPMCGWHVLVLVVALIWLADTIREAVRDGASSVRYEVWELRRRLFPEPKVNLLVKVPSVDDLPRRDDVGRPL